MSFPYQAAVLGIVAVLLCSGPALADPAPASRRIAFLDRVISAHPLPQTNDTERAGEIEGLAGDKPCYFTVVRTASCPDGWDCGFVSLTKGQMYDIMMSKMNVDGPEVDYLVSLRLTKNSYDAVNFDPFDMSERMAKEANLIYTSVLRAPHVENGQATIVEQTMSGFASHLPVGTVRLFQIRLDGGGDIAGVTGQVVTKLRQKVKFEIKATFKP